MLSFPRRDLADGRYFEVTPLTFGRARLHLGNVADPYCYADEW